MEDILSTIMIAAKMTSMLGDVTGLQQRNDRYKNLPHLFDRMEGFPPNALSFGNTATHKNYREEFHQPHPLPSYASVKVSICVYVQGLSQQALRDFLLLKSVY